MAIKIQGTTIIDDAANVSNICIINATSVCASANLYGSGTNLTNLPPNPVYACGIACSTINAGDPVSLICCNCGLAPTQGTLPAYTLTCSILCNSGLTDPTNGSDVATLRFCCSDCCFASMEFSGSRSSPCSDLWVTVRSHCISNTGTISSNVIYYCAFSRGAACCWWPSGKTVAVPGKSGNTGAFLTATNGGNGLQEIFLCYCTTSNTISVLRHCCSCMWSSCCNYHYFQPFVTPDGNYLVSFFTFNCTGCDFTSSCYNVTFPCGCLCYGAIVKATTDNVCYLTATPANSCTSLLNSVLPATCAWISGPTNCNFLRVAKGGMNPFSYGPDGWLLMHTNVCNTAVPATSASNPCPCMFSRFYAFKPIGDNCYALTNTLSTSNNAAVISNDGHPACSYIMTDMGFIWDRGDCVKRQLINCISCDVRSLGVGLGYFGSVGSVIQCFCVSGTTLCYLGCTTFAAPSNVCCQCLPPNNFSPLPYSAYNGCSPMYCWSGLPVPYNWTFDRNTNLCPTMFAGISSYYLRTLYQSSIPLCYQCGCFYVFASRNSSAGQECGINNCNCLTSCTYFGGNYLGAACNGPFQCSYDCGFGTQIRFDGTNFKLMCDGSVCAICCYYYDQANVNIISVCSIYCTGYQAGSQTLPPGYGWAYLNTNIASPVVMRNGAFLSGISIPQPTNCPSIFSLGCIACGSIVASDVVIGASTNRTITSNWQQWIGIAQNSANTGQSVCYATPGMVDRSPFSCCVCSLTQTSIIAGGQPCHFICSALGINPPSAVAMTSYYTTWYCCAFFLRCPCPGMSCPGNSLIGGFPSSGPYTLCYYNTNIQFTPSYDQGLGKWTTIISQKPTNYLSNCHTTPTCGINGISWFG